MEELLVWLVSILFVLTCLMGYGLVLATYVILMEKRRRDRTTQTSDDWTFRGGN